MGSLIQERVLVRQSGKCYLERRECHRISGERVVGEKEN